MRRIRMVVTDLDGTLLTTDDQVPAETSRRLAALSRHGVVVAIATGRSWRTALRVQRQLGLRGPFIAHNGAYVYDTKNRGQWYANRVPLGEARRMLAWATSRGIMMRCYLGVGQPVLFNLFTQEHRAHFQRPEDRVVNQLARTLEVKPVEMFLFGREDVDAFLKRFGTPNSAAGSSRATPRAPYETFLFDHPERGIREVNVCAPGVDKLDGVRAVCQRLGIQPDEVLAIGDGLNDLSLMRWAGMAAAMSTGVDIAKEAADYVTNPRHSDPVLDAIQWAWSRFGLTPPWEPDTPTSDAAW